MSRPAIIDELLADDNAGVSEIFGEPDIFRLILPPSYQLVIRTVTYPREDLKEGGEPVNPDDDSWITEVILETGEQIPVAVVGSATITPDYDAMSLDPDEPIPSVLLIRETDLTPEQAKRARWLVRRHAPRSEA